MIKRHWGFLLGLIFVCVTAYALSIPVHDGLTLRPTPSFSSCRNGTLLVDSSDSNTLKICSSGSFTDVDTVASAGAVTVEAKTASFTAAVGYLYEVNTSLGTVTATLPAAASNSGQSISFKLTDNTNTLIIDGNASETIEGLTTFSLLNNGEYLSITSNGSNWQITSKQLEELYIGSSQATSGTTTSSTFAAFSNNVSVTFTPRLSGRFKVYYPVVLFNSAASSRFAANVTATTGSPTTILSAELNADRASTGDSEGGLVYAIFRLTAGTTYVFQAYGKINTGTLTARWDLPAGNAMIAEYLGN